MENSGVHTDAGVAEDEVVDNVGHDGLNDQTIPS
jgi:hypothetical protein